jgi:uncharacterized protein YlxW (UPF0749 family)
MAEAPGVRSIEWRRVRSTLKPRATLAQFTVGILCVAVGFAVALQLRSTRGEVALDSASSTDLVGILDGLSQRSDQLSAEAARLERERAALVGGAGQQAAALSLARQRLQTLGILAGTSAAQGPGIVLTIADPHEGVDATTMIGIVAELRDAGAEAIQVNDVRVVADTYFLDEPGGVSADGQLLLPPYEVRAIGDPPTLASALSIPGGVLQSLARVDAVGTVTQLSQVMVDALKPLPTPQYASPGASP